MYTKFIPTLDFAMNSDAGVRRKKRKQRQKKLLDQKPKLSNENLATEEDKQVKGSNSDDKIAKLLTQSEDDLLNFVVKVNKVYQEKLCRPAPFMTFVICGMQSAGKSTIMERFMNAVLNIIQEGTGTRCPLDTTCIHDDTLKNAICDLSGEELQEDMGGASMSISNVFKSITAHNTNLAKEDRFSTKPLTLVYRSKCVQNMRFVDTPGIISNKGQGKDNREDIQSILRETMKRPNTKLCVLLEPKEYSTNPIIDFCDTTFGNRKWVENAIFIMNKFDKQFDDSRSGSKANNFFKEFHDNKIFPHLVMTPTLAKENLPPDKLFEARQILLNGASEKEKSCFDSWLFGHEKFLQSDPNDELLHKTVRARIGFETTKKVMREVMLEDTAQRLPEVLSSLRKDLGENQNKLKSLKEKKKFNDPNQIKVVVSQLLQKVQTRIVAYLDGDLETTSKMPHILQTLDDELEKEEESEWCNEYLNHHSEAEEDWRNKLSDIEYPEHIQAEVGLFGGKQIQRAIAVFGLVMIGE